MVDDQGIAEMERSIPQTEIFDVEHTGHMAADILNEAFNVGVMDFVRPNLLATSSVARNQTKHIL